MAASIVLVFGCWAEEGVVDPLPNCLSCLWTVGPSVPREDLGSTS